MSNHRSRIPALLGTVSVGLALVLTGCSGTGEETPTPTPAETSTASAAPSVSPTDVPVSTSIDDVTVAGDLGVAPTVSVDAPFAIDKVRTRVLSAGEGDGPEINAEATVEINYVGVNGRTGEVFDSSWTRGSAAVMALPNLVGGFQEGLVGGKPGDRILIVLPGSEGYDQAGGQPEAGIEVGDTLIFVVDINAIAVGGASGKESSPKLPVELSTRDDGSPQVTIPTDAAAPAELVVETVLTGAQRPVDAGDTILVMYRSYSWKTGKLIEDKYAEPDGGPLSTTLESWKTGLAGKPIGSRVVIVDPDPYPHGNKDPEVAAGDAVVFVVDILFSAAAPAGQ
ncbi:MAG: FKBP-type peptidyl-prolyl cis-trans isomerase [Propioniciclava sp.]